MSQQKSYTIETPDEKKFRIMTNVGVGLLFVAVGIFMIPTITKSVNNWIDFGIATSKLALLVGVTTLVVGTIWALRKPFYMKWRAFIQRMARKIYQTDLPGILQVIVDNRQTMLQNFSESVKKMLGAIGSHNDKIERRKQSMIENLNFAEQFKKKAEKADISPNEKQIALDNSRHHASEAAKDKDSLEKMIKESEKRRKSYDFFNRTLNNLRNDTSSITNEISRLKDEVEMTETWKNAAQNALKLLGVNPTEGMVLDEARKRIAENEAQVVSMIMDNQALLEKMEMKQDILDESGQLLLEQYSNQVDVLSFAEVKPVGTRETSRPSSFMENYKGLIN